MTFGEVIIPAVILVAAILATWGWLHIGRRQRMVMRTQHTFNALLQASFAKSFRDALTEVGPYIRAGKFPDSADDEYEELRPQIQFLLNYYEILAAGIRNGEMSERLLKDTDRGTILSLFEVAESSGYIASIRDQRKRKRIFEHLEWLYDRWHERPPPLWQRVIEALRGRPFYHRQSRWITPIIVGVFLYTAFLVYISN